MAVVLLSGGMDSTIALFHTLYNADFDSWGHPVQVLTFNYQQRHVAEIKHADIIFSIAREHYKEFLGLHKHLTFPRDLIPRVGSLMEPQVQVKKYKTIPAHGEPDPSFIPHRNMLLLTISAMWARRYQTNHIVTGIRGGFPDCTSAFEVVLKQALDASTPEFPITISSPVHGSRAASLEAARLIPGCWKALSYTMTCFEGTEPPCGACLPCMKRAEGFNKVGYPDPLLERLKG